MEIGYDFPDFAVNLKFLSKIFLQMIKTIIAPLLFGTLVLGIAGHSDVKQVGRMGWKSMLYFEIVTTIALFIGLFAINFTKAGVGIVMPTDMTEKLPDVQAQSWQDIIIHIFPENIAKAIFEGQVLQIVVFSILFGISLAMLPGIGYFKILVCFIIYLIWRLIGFYFIGFSADWFNDQIAFSEIC